MEYLVDYDLEENAKKPHHACDLLRYDLKMCLLESDCCKKYGKTPKQCLQDESMRDHVDDECRRLAYTFFECKRSMIDMRARFRGRKINVMLLRNSLLTLVVRCCYQHVKRQLTNENIVDHLYNGTMNGDRSCLAKSITLIESTNEIKRKHAKELLTKVLSGLKQKQEKKQGQPISFRIGLTGAPGSGKSTFIEVFGRYLIEKGHKVAVLTVDPSSTTTGGSILGDKTRMVELSRERQAYIRSSPSSGSLGGVTRTTNDSIALCELAGYDIVLVETVGVGQSEYAVADMVDMLCVLLPPGSGDEMQGIKKGIMELVDLMIITKADGELLPEVRRLQTEYSSAMRLMRRRFHNWTPKVISVSSRTNIGIDKAWINMLNYQNKMLESNQFFLKRKHQLKKWMWSNIRNYMLDYFLNDNDIQTHIKHYENDVENGRMTPGLAADEVLKLFIEQRRL
ncbi:unnamed protein product [Didymodactylos carnosus]|uniref:Uncharacterized protein n=1 Tax=Didymodactylos carnosus TaxID=1234261 RepID=A0A813V7H3_9BILA|nr:unnamed protein product [Didymodactylos carnosus]CAF3624389.1 unnamed protein product [Didymodactylos carnosus]